MAEGGGFLRDLLSRFRIVVDRTQLRAANQEMQTSAKLAGDVKAALGSVGQAVFSNPSIRRLEQDLERAQVAAERLAKRVAMTGGGTGASKDVAGIPSKANVEIEAARAALRGIQSGGAQSPELVALGEQAKRAETLVTRLGDKLRETRAAAEAPYAAQISELDAKLKISAESAQRLAVRLKELKSQGAPAEQQTMLRQSLEKDRAAVARLKLDLDQLRAVQVDSPRIRQLEARLETVQNAARGARAQIETINAAQTSAVQAQVGALSARMRELAKESNGASRGLANAAREAEKMKLSTTAVLSPVQRFTQLLDDSRQKGEGFLAEMGRIRRIFGLLQFGAAFIGIQHFFQGAFKAAEAIDATSKALNISTKALQTWNAFANMAGATEQDIVVTFRALAKNASDAANGSKAQAHAFKELGVEVTTADGELRPLSELLTEVGGKLGPMDNATKKLALAQQTLGRSAIKLLPAFKGGTEEVKKQMEELSKLAVVYDDQFIEQSEAAGDELFLFGLQLQKIRALLINFFLPIIRSTMQVMIPFVNQLAHSIKISEAVKSAFILLGARGLDYLRGRFMVFFKAVGGLGGVLRAIAALVWRVILPFLIFDDILVFLQGGDSALGHILNKMIGLEGKEAVLKTLRGAWDALTTSITLAFDALDGEISDENMSAFLRASQPIADFFEKTLPEAIDFAKRDLQAWLESVAQDILHFLAPPGGLLDTWLGWGDQMTAGLADKAATWGTEILSALIYPIPLLLEGWNAMAPGFDSFLAAWDATVGTVKAIWDAFWGGVLEQVARVENLVNQITGNAPEARGALGTFRNPAESLGSRVAGTFGTTELGPPSISNDSSRSAVYNDHRKISVAVGAPSDTSPAGLSRFVAKAVDGLDNMNNSNFGKLKRAF